MKRKFIEPEMKRIELNLTENIASSNTYSDKGVIRVSIGFDGCDTCVQDQEDISYGPGMLMDPNYERIRGCIILFLSRSETARMLGLPTPSDVR